MSELSIQLAKASSVELPEMPIEPGWILKGSPQARGTVLVQSTDQLVSCGLWSCTAGEFRWEFAWDEFVQIIDGDVFIAEEGGAAHHLQAGDVAHFPRGLKTRWRVPAFIQKVFTIRTAEPFVL